MVRRKPEEDKAGYEHLRVCLLAFTRSFEKKVIDKHHKDVRNLIDAVIYFCVEIGDVSRYPRFLDARNKVNATEDHSVAYADIYFACVKPDLPAAMSLAEQLRQESERTCAIGEVQLRNRLFGDAHISFSKALEPACDGFGESHLKTVQSRVGLARTLACMKKTDSARDCLIEANKVVQRVGATEGLVGRMAEACFENIDVDFVEDKMTSFYIEIAEHVNRKLPRSLFQTVDSEEMFLKAVGTSFTENRRK